MADTLPLDAFRIGDIITVKGPSVPREWWNRPMRVTSLSSDGLPTMELLPLDETPAEFHARADEALRRARADS